MPGVPRACPGSLPVLNHQVVELAMRLGRALNCSVEPSVFARKNYFYPDMPKDYQVTQFDQPINVDGWLDLPDGTRVGIERAHIEEDTGKNTHAGGSGRIHGADYSLVDYNRAGVPLVEIVGRPDIRHPEQAKAYVDELRAILLATGASDAKMEEGSLRVDANVSVRRVGDPELGTRCEIKNLNSLRSLGRAIEYEARRQVDLLEAGETVKQETRHWDEGAGRTRPGRSKEEAEDYRYFQEPDLVPLAPAAEWVAAIDAAMPPLPAERRSILAAAAGVEPTETAVVVAVQRDLDALALAAIAAGGDGPRVLLHVEHNLAVDGRRGARPRPLRRAGAAWRSTVSSPPPRPRRCWPTWSTSGRDPDAIAADHGFEAMDTSELEGIVDGIIAESPGRVGRLRGGDDKRRGKLQGFFVGKVMKATQRPGRRQGRQRHPRRPSLGGVLSSAAQAHHRRPDCRIRTGRASARSGRREQPSPAGRPDDPHRDTHLHRPGGRPPPRAAGACSGSEDDTAPDSTTTVTASSPTTSGKLGDLSDLDGAAAGLSGAALDCYNVQLAVFALAAVPSGYLGGSSPADLDSLQADLDTLRGQLPAAVTNDFDAYVAGILAYAEAVKGHQRGRHHRPGDPAADPGGVGQARCPRGPVRARRDPELPRPDLPGPERLSGGPTARPTVHRTAPVTAQ